MEESGAGERDGEGEKLSLHRHFPPVLEML